MKGVIGEELVSGYESIYGIVLLTFWRGGFLSTGVITWIEIKLWEHFCNCGNIFVAVRTKYLKQCFKTLAEPRYWDITGKCHICHIITCQISLLLLLTTLITTISNMQATSF